MPRRNSHRDIAALKERLFRKELHRLQVKNKKLSAKCEREQREHILGCTAKTCDDCSRYEKLFPELVAETRAERRIKGMKRVRMLVK